MDRFEAMRVYMRVSELSSFVKAADSLGMSKASISTIIQQLEEQMGTRLLHRTTRKVQMTQDGIAFYERCKDLISDVEELESLFRKDVKGIKGRLRVDMPNTIAKAVVIPKLPEFLEKYPGIEIELSSTDRKVDMISEGFDCVVRIGTLADSGHIVRKIGELTLINCVSPSYIKLHGKPKTLDDLSNHQLIHYTQSLGAKPEGFEYFDGNEYKSVDMKGRVSVNNTDSYTAACLAGLGIIQVPASGAKVHIENKLLVEVLPNLKALSMPVSIIYPHRRNLTKRVQIFMDWLEDVVKDYIQ